MDGGGEELLTLQRYRSFGWSFGVSGHTRVVPDVVGSDIADDERHHDSVEGLLYLHRPIATTRIHISIWWKEERKKARISSEEKKSKSRVEFSRNLSPISCGDTALFIQ